MAGDDHVYLVFLAIALVAFGVTGGIGIATWRPWRNRRGTPHTRTDHPMPPG